MESRIRYFSSILELSEKKQIKYKKLEQINKLLERETQLNYENIIDSYTKNLVGSLDIDYIKASELDYQMKFLIEENKIALTSILDFANDKFPTIKSFLMSIFEQSTIFVGIHNIGGMIAINTNLEKEREQIIDKIFKIQKGELEILFKNPMNNSKISYLIEFNLEDIPGLKKFKEEIIGFDINKFMNAKHVIIVGIGVSK